jgi:hypothetical protein
MGNILNQIYNLSNEDIRDRMRYCTEQANLQHNKQDNDQSFPIESIASIVDFDILR